MTALAWTVAAIGWCGFLIALALLTVAIRGNQDVAAENRDLRRSTDERYDEWAGGDCG